MAFLVTLLILRSLILFIWDFFQTKGLNKKRALMIIGLAVAMTGGSFAVQAEETDVAKVKCSEFIQDKESMGMLLMWLDGYASQKSDNTVLSDEWIEKLGAHMGKYCSENPDTTILDAAQAMEE